MCGSLTQAKVLRLACRGMQFLRPCHPLSWVPGHLLGWFLHGAVGAKGLQLLLYPSQRVGKLAVVEDGDGLLDPGEQVRSQAAVLLNHLLGLDGVVNDLWDHLVSRTMGVCGRSPATWTKSGVSRRQGGLFQVGSVA